MKKSKKTWCAVHCVGGEVSQFGTEREIKKWCKRNSFNPDPNYHLYYPMPISGIQITEKKITFKNIQEMKPVLKSIILEIFSELGKTK